MAQEKMIFVIPCLVAVTALNKDAAIDRVLEWLDDEAATTHSPVAAGTTILNPGDKTSACSEGLDAGAFLDAMSKDVEPQWLRDNSPFTVQEPE